LATGATLNSPTVSDYETFTAASAPTYTSGRLWYDSTLNALSYNNDVTNNTLHIGQETQLKVYNNTGSTIAKGAPVYITSTTSGFTYPLIALAKADTQTTGACIGLTNEAIATGSAGYVVINGILNGVNTGTFTVGDILYVSPYSAGQLMNTYPPTAYAVQIGTVAYVNSSNGSIYVNQSNAYVLSNGIIGQVAIANGGTNGTATPTAGGVAYGSGTAYAFTAVGTTGQVLTSAGSGTPTWTSPASSITLSDDTTTNATRYPLFASATSGTVSTEYTSSSKYQYNPSTGTLTTSALVTSGGTIDNNIIGGTTPVAGSFSTLQGGKNLANYIQAVGGATTVAPVVSAQGSDGNIPLVLQPKGTGALQAQLTDSTATGGNARGANAVDWQTLRSAATQVASGTQAVISGGAYNAVSGGISFIGGGSTNSSPGYSSSILGGTLNTVGATGNFISYGVVGGGQSNSALGSYNFIGGGFTNSGTASAAVTTQSGTMNATTAVTLSASNASIKVGQYITGTSIAGDTYVAAISGTALTLSKNASGSSTSTLSFYTPHGIVVGGGNNQATGSYSFIGGGGDAGTAANRNVASGDWSFVGGGIKNTSSASASVVVGGGSYGSGFAANTASGTSSFVGAGYQNSAGGFAGVVVGGSGNGQTNNAGFIGAGSNNTANSNNAAIAGGAYGTSRSVEGYAVFPAHNNPIASASGVSQGALLVLGVQTTDATATVLRSNSSAASSTNQVILPNNSAYYFRGEVVAGVTGGGNTAAWTFEGAIKRGAGVGTTAIVGTVIINRTTYDSGASGWSITVTADTTNGGLAITVTGQASTTIRWVAQVRTTEMTY
jgi:hypothetical protein